MGTRTSVAQGVIDPRSYYAATAVPRPPAPSLACDTRADVCVVGGGLTGLSSALRLAERGLAVTLLEADRVGAGASGVNGGQLIPGFRHGAATLSRRFGTARAKALIDLTLEARAAMAALVEARAIPCDLHLTGHLTAAAAAADMADLATEAAALTALDYPGATLLDPAATRAHVASTAYHGGLHDALGGHVNPLALVHGLADAAAAAGVTLHEATAALEIEGDRVTTPHGAVHARHIVLACDARAGTVRLAGRPALARRMMPVWSYSIATEPLGEAAARALLPTNAAVSDTRFALDYYRRSADHRLLFSGGERYTLSPLADVAGFVRPHLVRAFPSLAGARIDHAWAGTVAITTSRFPHVGRAGALWWAHGYSGHGLLLAQAAGRALAHAITGQPAAFDLLAALPTRDWPGGAALRRPLYTAGMLVYAARDRLRRSPPPTGATA